MNERLLYLLFQLIYYTLFTFMPATPPSSAHFSDSVFGNGHMGAGAEMTGIQHSMATDPGVFVEHSHVVAIATGSMVSVLSLGRHKPTVFVSAQNSMQDMDMQPVEAATSAETSFTSLNQLVYPSGGTGSSTAACNTLVASDWAKEEKVNVCIDRWFGCQR